MLHILFEVAGQLLLLSFRVFVPVALHSFVHALQHSFFSGSLVIWGSVVLPVTVSWSLKVSPSGPLVRVGPLAPSVVVSSLMIGPA